ncbi:MAG: alpha-D-ribose 1-methylphosphonate 5-triphosphate diphosphatase, partial [Comamonadaceae bacterium CG_4_9_14_0_8_um_filter_57_21]
MSRFLLTHARVVFANEVRDDVAILIDNGIIAAIDPQAAGNTRALDLSGHLLVPGLIDLHCDALEKEVEPRPGVHFPLDFACAQADKRNAV